MKVDRVYKKLNSICIRKTGMSAVDVHVNFLIDHEHIHGFSHGYESKSLVNRIYFAMKYIINKGK